MLTDQEKEALKIKRELGALLKSPGWGIVTRLVDAQVRSRTDHVILTPVNMDQIPAQEYMKGEIGGLRLVAKLVEAEYENAEALVESLDHDNDPE